MNTAVRIRGWITEASVIDPKLSIYESQKVYRIHINPALPHIYSELEESIASLKEESERQTVQDDPLVQHTYSREDKVIQGCEIAMESLYKPKLLGSFKDFERDDELLGKFAQGVGHLQILKDGNVFLSVHMIEPQTFIDEFDPLD